MPKQLNRQPLIAAGTFLGAGMGGFVDGILFHQILQWHGMLTNRFPKTGVDFETAFRNAQINMFWDGIFHAFTWLMVAIGIALLWRAWQRTEVPLTTRTFIGSLAIGWGLFNLAEGLLDHHILHLHHVTEDSEHLVWDIGFLVYGGLLAAFGTMLIRSDRHIAPEEQQESNSR